MQIRQMSRLLAVLFLPVLFSLQVLAGKDISELSAGMPQNFTQKQLPASQYATFQVQKLANGELVWLNAPLLREMGFDVPEKITPEFQAKVIDALGWVSSDQLLEPGDVTDQKREMVADYYGGMGIGHNHGSARAASAGYVQLKGVGVTPLLKNLDDKHTARSTLHESMKDAIWGEVLNNELPFGGNRLVAILDRGGPLENGEPQFVEVRIDPIRVGHFMRREYLSYDSDISRTIKSQNHLLKNLPVPQGGYPSKANQGEKIVLGAEEYARRVAMQTATMHFKRLFHGAHSQSNIEISGRMIDFGTASAQPGYHQIFFIPQIEAFGHFEQMVEFWVESVGRAWQGKWGPTPLAPKIEKGLATLSQKRKASYESLEQVMLETFQSTFNETAEKLALQATGVPKALVDRLWKENLELARWLLSLIEKDLANSERVNLQSGNSINHLSEGTLQALVDQLETAKYLTPKEIAKIFQNLNLPANSGESLTAFYSKAQALAKREGVSAANFRALVQANAKFNYRPMKDLYLPELRAQTQAVALNYLRGETSLVGERINEIVTNSIRSIPDLAWYEAPVRILVDPQTGKRKVTVFDAVKGETENRTLELKDRLLSMQRPSVAAPGLCSKIHSAR